MQNLIKIVFLFITAFGYSQPKNIAVKLIATEKTDAALFLEKDAFGNSYTLLDNEFRKENKSQKFQYRNLALGKIEQVDLQNPLQIVLFYKTMNSVVLLDNQLNETIKINFSETNPELLPQWVSLASQNRLWLFDLATQKLGLYDYQKKNFQPISVQFEIPIKFSQSDYNYFYWIDTNQNWQVSNLYGKINFLGKIPEFDKIQIISSKQILLKKDNILSLLDLEKETSQIISIPEKSFDTFCYKEQILSIFTTNEIRNYKIILP
jgi:hypothetical protein